MDPNKRLTPLQRRRLKDGKPISSRQFNDAEIKIEDQIDKQKLAGLERKVTSPERKKQEVDDLEDRKEARHEEHKRREALRIRLAEEQAEANRIKAEQFAAEMDKDMAEKEAEEKAKRQQRIMERNAKMGESEGPSQDTESGQPDRGQEVPAQESAADVAENQRQLQEQAAIAAERDRLEAMVDEAVMTEERRLRAMLDNGRPDKLDDVTRRLRANDPRLIKVTLRQNVIGFPEAARLADAIAHNTSLLSLDFRYNKIGDYGCKLLADAIQICPSIGELRVKPNETGRAGMEALQDAANLCQYEAMSISSATLAMPEDSFSPLLLRAPNEPMDDGY